MITAALVGGLVYFLKPNQTDTASLQTATRAGAARATTVEHPTTTPEAGRSRHPASRDTSPSLDVASVDVVAEKLRKRLEKEPNDMDGWALLGRSYIYLKNESKAREAFAKAVSLGYSGPIPDFTGASGSRSPHSQPVANPHESMNLLASSIQTVTQKKAAPAGEKKAGPFAKGIPVKISLAESVTGKVSAGDVVFIFARAPSGPKMPLAVVKKQVGDLPLTLTLTDAASMMPTFSLSGADAVIIGARISKSGGVEKQPGDFEVLSSTISQTPEQPVELMIEKQI